MLYGLDEFLFQADIEDAGKVFEAISLFYQGIKCYLQLFESVS